MSKFKSNQEFFDFSVKLVVVPIKDIVERMIEHHVKLPLFVYRFLLKETIREEVFEAKRFETYTDELQYRLRNYDCHSIFLLEKLIHKYDITFDLSKFKEMLLNFIYLNKNAKTINTSFFDDIVEFKEQYDIDVEILPYDDFYRHIESVLYQTTGYIDGLREEDWTDEALASHTLGDLKALGQEYDIKVPRRINKSRLIDILSAKLKLSEDEVESLSKKSILDIEIYARENDFRISTDLKKRDMLEFIKYSLGMYHKDIPDDEFDYNIPISHLEETLEEDIAEDIIEEEVEEVIEDQETLEEEMPIKETIQEEEIEIQEEKKQALVNEVKEVKETKKVKEVKKEKPVVQEIKEEEDDSELTSVSDSELLTEEEKELLDEKIAYIIRRYHKKKRRRKIIKIFFISLFVLILAFAVYSYIHFHYLTDGELPFNIPLFWK